MIRTKRITALMLCATWYLLIAAQRVAAQGAGDIFRAANESYTTGDFNAAADLYEKILRTQNAFSAEVYYNLGNVCYRLNRPGKAVLNWERALRITPRDSDIRFNLEFVRRHLYAEQEQKKAFEIIEGWLTGLITTNELAVILFIVYSLCALSFILFIFTKKPLFRTLSISIGTAVLLCAVWMYILYQYHVASRRAVVISQTAEVRNGPDESFNVGFTASEGMEILLLRESGKWQEIGITGKGLKGWVKKEDVEAI